MKEYILNVREIEGKDVQPLADYWLNAEDSFLVGMGVDLCKMPSRKQLSNMLQTQINSSIQEKVSYALIWELNGIQVGHTNVNNIVIGQSATMHLHLWNSTTRRKGMGLEFLKASLPFYFDKLDLQKIICEPYSLNPAPNRMMEKIGFEFDKKYTTIPGSLNFEQEVNRWILTKDKYFKLQKPLE